MHLIIKFLINVSIAGCVRSLVLLLSLFDRSVRFDFCRLDPLPRFESTTPHTHTYTHARVHTHTYTHTHTHTQTLY
jgi:hypothetical protein